MIPIHENLSLTGDFNCSIEKLTRKTIKLMIFLTEVLRLINDWKIAQRCECNRSSIRMRASSKMPKTTVQVKWGTLEETHSHTN